MGTLIWLMLSMTPVSASGSLSQLLEGSGLGGGRVWLGSLFRHPFLSPVVPVTDPGTAVNMSV